MTHSAENLTRYLTDNKLLDDLTKTANGLGYTCWLVGGALRDVLLGRPVTDIDLATPADPTPLAKQWAKEQGAHWFWLDQERQQSRVLLRYGKLEFNFDFVPLRAATLNEDLHLRDFTINAMALPLRFPLADQELIDPLQGRQDLYDSLIRECSPRSMEDDPLRMLKGIRHCLDLSMELEEETESRIRELAPRLANSAGERKRNELGRIFTSPRRGGGLEILHRCGLLKILFGSEQTSFSLQRSISELSSLDVALEQSAEIELFKDLYEEYFDETIDRRTLYLIAMFLVHYGCRHSVPVLSEWLRFSRKAVAVVVALLSLDPNRMAFAKLLPKSERARALWLEQQGTTAVDQLIFYASTVGREGISLPEVNLFLQAYSSLLVQGRVPDLLNGRDIKHMFPQLDGKAIGELQKRIKQAEITGEISSKEDAEKLLLKEKPIDKN